MTVEELIKALQYLGEENQNKQVIMFDGPSYYIPCRVKILDGQFSHLQGKVLID